MCYNANESRKQEVLALEDSRPAVPDAQQTYCSIRSSIVNAQRKLTTAVNSAMVGAYWEVGEQIYKACGESDRAEYGKRLLEYLSARLTAEFGKGFSVQNLRNMRQFYCMFPIRYTRVAPPATMC